MYKNRNKIGGFPFEEELLMLEDQTTRLEFQRVFSREVVEADPNERPFAVNGENMEKLFDVLNGLFFDGKLEKIPVVSMTLSRSISFFRKKLKRDVNIYTLANAVSLFYNDVELNEQTQKYEIVPESEFIFIRIENDGMMSFGYAAAVLLHEMIHYYDAMYGTLIESQLQQMKTHNNLEIHKTPVFVKYERAARERDVLVKDVVGNATYFQLNREAQMYLLGLPVGETKLETTRARYKTSISYRLDDGRIANLFF